PFPLIVFAALALGLLGGRLWPGQLGEVSKPAETTAPAAAPIGWRRTLRTAAIGAALWFAPVVAAGLTQGWDGTLTQLGWFFSKAAVVTFGGAYAVLPYVAQQAVSHYHWLGAGQMIDGLAFAETTPGPLILVLQFVGFLAGWHHAGGMSLLVAASLGAALTVWVTFVPTYLFILLGAPYVERLRGVATLSAALAAVTAAVVGVILNLAVWFGLHVFLPPGPAGRVDWFAVAVGAAALLVLQRWKVGIVPVVLAAGTLGLGLSWV
ncbi:MAG: chromate transporter, partial [Opitutales bacterium]